MNDFFHQSTSLWSSVIPLCNKEAESCFSNKVFMCACKKPPTPALVCRVRGRAVLDFLSSALLRLSRRVSLTACSLRAYALRPFFSPSSVLETWPRWVALTVEHYPTLNGS